MLDTLSRDDRLRLIRFVCSFAWADLEINEADMYAVVQPGVVTDKLAAAVEAKGLFYPPDPASQSACTIGGNIGECAGGLTGLKYGTTRNYVLGLELVTPEGKLIRTGARTVKSVAGYDVTRLMVGSEGTLGVFTKITLKLKENAVAIAHLDDKGAARAHLPAVRRRRQLHHVLAPGPGEPLVAAAGEAEVLLVAHDGQPVDGGQLAGDGGRGPVPVLDHAGDDGSVGTPFSLASSGTTRARTQSCARARSGR